MDRTIPKIVGPPLTVLTLKSVQSADLLIQLTADHSWSKSRLYLENLKFERTIFSGLLEVISDNTATQFLHATLQIALQLQNQNDFYYTGYTTINEQFDWVTLQCYLFSNLKSVGVIFIKKF